jgi:CheY-like chemotaxis protein
VVDDDPLSHFITESRLRVISKDFRIQRFSNGRKLLDFFETKWENEDEFFPALMLLDLNMPVMDGFEFLSKFQSLKNSDKCDVVILSSSTRDVDKETSKEYPQVLGYIEKPFDGDQFLALIK